MSEQQARMVLSGQPEHLVLSVFPGIDLLGRAVELEMPDVCLVRGPDLLWGGDIRTWHAPPGVFWGICGEPPCQCFSRLRHLVEYNGYKLAENLIPEFERVVVEAQPTWFLMENVPEAPEPSVPGYLIDNVIFNNRWTGADQNRRRRFCFGTKDGRRLTPYLETVALESPVWEPAVLAHGGGRPAPVAIGGSGKMKPRAREIGFQSIAYFCRACVLQGLPDDFDLPGFTVEAKVRALGNGVPLPLGWAIARAVWRALGVPA